MTPPGGRGRKQGTTGKAASGATAGTLYVRPADGAWHWCRNCPDFPHERAVETSDWGPKEGTFCAQCLKRTEAGDCDRRR